MHRHARHPKISASLPGILGIVLLLSMVSVVYAASSGTAAPGVTQYIRLYHNTETLNHPQLVAAFYRGNRFQPVWGESTRAHARADSLLHVLRQSYREGLVYAGHSLSGIESYRYSMQARYIAWFDVLMTDAFISYVQQAGRGQVNPYQLQENWHYPLPEVDALALLKQVLRDDNVMSVLTGLSPQIDSYRRLVDALDRYTSIKADGGWPQIPLYGEPLEYGDQSEEIVLLKRRLQITGDLPENASLHAVFDYELQEAVRRFQARYGLEQDGVVGEKTRFALHAPVEKRIQQIIVNLERWRWLPRDLGRRHIRVNTARFDLRAFEDDKKVLSMRVVVGETEHKTPAFSEDMQYLVLNPYWNVPNKIARDELIRTEQANPGHLTRMNVRVLSGSKKLDPMKIDWSRYEGMKQLPVRLRQDPGPRNALGRIKFMLPNKYRVYLHDTPARIFFDSRVRTFSHGCVRVEDPLKLADYVLGEKWSARALQRVIDSGKNRYVKLPEPLPVHIYYHTVWADESGRVNFRNDVYNKDRLIMARMPSARPVAEKVFIVSDEQQPSLSLLGDSSENAAVN